MSSNSFPRSRLCLVPCQKDLIDINSNENSSSYSTTPSADLDLSNCFEETSLSDAEVHTDECTVLDMSSVNDKDRVLMAKRVELLSDVIHTLKDSDKIDITFTELILNKKLPMRNTAFFLFTDGMEWFSTENTHQIRYSDNIKQFWHVGQNFVKGKFLRIMSGWKNQGQDSKGLSRRVHSTINCAVPDSRCLDDAPMVNKMRNIKPDVCDDDPLK
jgi:hypothetical protein